MGPFFDARRWCSSSCRINNIQNDVFYVIIDSMIVGLSTRYTKLIASLGSSGDILPWQSSKFQQLVLPWQRDTKVTSHKMNWEMNCRISNQFMLQILERNPYTHTASWIKIKHGEIFPNVCIALRVFCNLPVTVASTERSFSKLKLSKNFLWSTMTQERLNDLATLSIESELARKLEFWWYHSFLCTEKTRYVLNMLIKTLFNFTACGATVKQGWPI